MSKANNFVFRFLQIVAWVIFVGLSIEAGGLLVNFFFSLYKPELLPRLYQKMDLTDLYNQSRAAFFASYTFLLTIVILKVCLFYIVAMLTHKLDLSKPFNTFVATKIARISYLTLSIGLLSCIAAEFSRNLMHRGAAISPLNQFWADGEAFVLMGAVIYIIATIFKKGVDLQTENELTV